MLKKYVILLLLCLCILNILVLLSQTELPSFCLSHQLPEVPILAGHQVPLYVVTPTYSRAAQLAELTRLYQALYPVQNITWVVVEDSYIHTQKVTKFLDRVQVSTGQYYRFLVTVDVKQRLQSTKDTVKFIL